MLSCREVNRILKPYVCGELPFSERFDLQRHLAICPTCARKVEQARDALDLTGSFAASASDPAPDDVPDALLAAILFSSHHP